MSREPTPRNGVPRDFDALRRGGHGPEGRASEAADPGRGLCARQHPTRLPSARRRASPRRPGCSLRPWCGLRINSALPAFPTCRPVFRERLKNRNVSYQERIVALRGAASGSPELAILNGFLDAASQSISKLPQRLDLKRFRAASKLLAGADTIYLIARRRSFPLASYMAYGFGKMGIKAQLLGSPVGIDDEVVAYATPKDAAIAISFNPYAPETVRQTRAITALGVPVIAITDSCIQCHCGPRRALVRDRGGRFRRFPLAFRLDGLLHGADRRGRRCAQEWYGMTHSSLTVNIECMFHFCASQARYARRLATRRPSEGP